MRILICDDDLRIIEQLQKYIIDYFKQKKLKIPEICTYYNGEEILRDSNEKDIVFLDVEMPGLSGIYVGDQLKKKNRNTIIIIITSFIEYLDDAMRFHVFRYLSKPLDKQRFYQNMKDAIQLYTSTNSKIPIETKEGVFTICTYDIIFVEAQGRTITVNTINRKYTAIPKMQHWVTVLNMPCFFMSHRSFIVNMQYVTKFDNSLIYLYNNEYIAYLTKRKYSEFKNAYFLYIESTR